MGMNDQMGRAVPGADATNHFNCDLDIADLSAEASYFIPVPFSARLVRAYSAIDGVVATADVTITLKDNAGTALTNGVITITQAGSAAGDVDSCDPSANNTFAQGQRLEMLVTGGGAGGSPRGHVTCIFEKTGP